MDSNISPNNSSCKDLSLSNNLDDIIDLYFCLKENLSPYFLEYLKTSVPFTEFILNILYNNNYKNNYYNSMITPDYLIFKNDFYDEISLSYDLVNKFLKLRNKFVSRNSWEYFCFYYSHYKN